MTEWRTSVPIVRIMPGLGQEEPRVYTGYSAHIENSGAVVIYEVEPEPLDAERTRRKKFGKSVVLANGMWERIECEWQPVGAGGLTT